MMARVPVPLESVVARVRRAGDVVRRVIGVPDYERYVAHMEAAHPSETVLSHDDFERERMTARYQRPGARCC